MKTEKQSESALDRGETGMERIDAGFAVAYIDGEHFANNMGGLDGGGIGCGSRRLRVGCLSCHGSLWGAAALQ